MGQYQSGAASDQTPATLGISSDAQQYLTLKAAGWHKQVPSTDLVVSERLGSIPRRLQWGTSEVFVCGDNDAVDALIAKLPGYERGSRLHRWESSLSLAVGALVIVVALYAGLMFWGVPTASAYFAHRIPPELANQVAEQSLEMLDDDWFEPSRLPLERRRGLRERLLALDNFPQEIHFRSSNIGPNAFALPAGHIVITDDLVKLAGAEAEIEAVYLHEVGHARGHHAETMALQNSVWLVLLTMITGDINGVSEALFAIPVTLGQMSYSRELEHEADSYAIDTLTRLGRSPQPLATMLDKLSRLSTGR